MKLTQEIYSCRSGAFGLMPAGDCRCYVLDDGSELALIDRGLAGNPQAILLQMEKGDLNIGKLKYLFLARAHPDHANGSVWSREHLGVQVVASAFGARVMGQGLLEAPDVYPEPGLYEQFDNMGHNGVDRIIEDDEEMQVGELRVRAPLTSGHAVGSTSYEVETGSRRYIFMRDEIFYQGFVSILTAPFSDYEHYYEGLKRLGGRGVDGLFPSHLMWALQDGQKHIDKALWDFEAPQRPNLKSFS